MYSSTLRPKKTEFMSASANASFPIDDKKTIRAWAFFDWANSAYALVITTAIFPLYFLAIAPDEINILGVNYSDTSVLSYAISISYILIALIAPLLGGIADAGGKRLRFLKIFTVVGSLACMGLWWFTEDPVGLLSSVDYMWVGLVAFVVSTIGYAGSLIFYDAFLPAISSKHNFDKVSAMGYAYGYIGSVILLVFILFLSEKPEFFGMDAEAGSRPFRLGFILVGIWWLGWSQYTFRHLPQDKKSDGEKTLIREGYREMKKVFAELKFKSNLRRFLMAFFFYSAGVNTVIYLATAFADKELNFTKTENIITVLILQLVAVVGAIGFARYAKAKGSKKAIVIMIIIWMLICCAAALVTTKPVFFLLAFFVGLVLGGLQSSSRASYSKLIAEEEEYNLYFSFYDLLYYISIVFGTFAFGLVNQLTHNLRYSVLVLAVFFVIALIIFSRVEIKHEKAPAIA